MVDLGEDAGLAFLPFVGAANLSVVSAPVPLVYFVQDFAVPDVAADLASQGHSYHFLRDMLSAEFAEELGVRFIRNRPCVTMLDIGVAINEQGEQVFQYQLDLVQPTLLAAPLDGARAVYPAQLVEGVLSQVAERNLLEVGASTFPEIIGATFTNIGVIFEAAAAQEIGIRTLSPEKGLPDDLAGAISPTAKARIEEHLTQGLVVVVPERPVELDSGSLTGWWAIDPTTGRTVDRLETGRGSELGEHATLLDVVVHVIHETYVLGMCVAGIAAVVVSAVFVISDYQADAALGGAVAGGTVAFAFCAAAVA
jgi:hypothetical protein